MLRLGAVALDSDDPERLAQFWNRLLGGRIAYSSPDFVSVEAGPLRLNVHRVPDHRAPTWPSGTTPKQMHLDVEVDDLNAAQARAVELGAQPCAAQPDPTRWRVLIDPAGHPFCLTTQFPT